jgi:hypothetical protein
MGNDNSNTDHLQGNVIMEMEVTKMANGQFKATCAGMEANHHNSDHAVLQLQDKLQAALLSGDLRPDM